MLLRLLIACVLLLTSASAYALECLAPKGDVQPVLIIASVRSNISGIDSGDLNRELRELLARSGRFKILLPDQYRFAEANGRIDRCTPSFAAEIEVRMSNSDPGARMGLGGFVKRTEFKAVARVTLLPERVTLDEFAVEDKADTFIAGDAASKAFVRLFENIALQFESRRDGWIREKIPGFGAAASMPPVSRDSHVSSSPSVSPTKCVSSLDERPNFVSKPSEAPINVALNKALGKGFKGGRASVSINYDANGTVTSASIAQSSGDQDLDRAVASWARGAKIATTGCAGHGVFEVSLYAN